MSKELKKEVLDWLENNYEEFKEIADQIWAHPELSMQEHMASGLMKDVLKKHGFEILENAGGMPTAFVASYGSGRPVLGFNCEYDALPGLSQQDTIPEKTPVVPGAPGQGCGHNMLGTASVRAAIALRYLLEKHGMQGTSKVLGAPAEELCLGKPFLGKAGLLEGYDAMIDWHPWSSNRADYDGAEAYFNVKFHYKGRTAHGNSPWHGRSALDACILQGTATEYLREHIPPGNPPDAANTLNYTFSDTGPEFPSVVPDRATIWYVGRFETVDLAKEILQRVENCAKGAALQTDTEMEMELITFTNHKLPNKTLAEVMHRCFQEIGPPAFTEEEQETAKKIQAEFGVKQTGLATTIRPFGGGYSIVLDTSEYSWSMPYTLAWIAVAPENIGWHNWGVTYCANNSMGVKCMKKASDLIAVTCVELLCNPELVAKAQEEFLASTGGKPYQCQLPEDMEPPVDMNADVMALYRDK